MYTSIVLAALMGPGAAPQVQAPEAPSWQENYSAARKDARLQNKPLAVFIGSGEKGWEKLAQESKLTSDVQKMLADSFVCVYVDTDAPSGKRLADEFEMTQGLVLSTRDGESQAFSHSGRMSSKELASSLLRYSNGYISTHTESLDQLQNAGPGGHKAATTAAPTYFLGGSGCRSCGR